MSFQAVLVYDLLTGFQNNAAVTTRVAGISSLNVTETAAALGFDRVGDMTVSTGPARAQRTITLKTNAVGDRLWSTAAQVKAITTALFRGGLAVLTPTLVTASDPVVTQV